MPELRKDPVVGRWVIISTERGRRPSDFGRAESPPKSGFCPFCPGHEDKTPPEVYASRDDGTSPDGPGWHVRVVSNKYPALQIEGDLDKQAEGIYDRMNGVGAHEVIIESPDHEAELSQLPVGQIAKVIRALRARVLDLAKDSRFRYVQIFKNHGEAAGASLEHPHTQLIATPIVPQRVMAEILGSNQHYALKDRCIYCDVIRQEMSFKRRIVTESASHICLEPFASRFPFETWIMPKKHQTFFERGDEADDVALAAVLKEALARISATLNGPPYNFVVHTGPINEWEGPMHFHWHIEIMPKLTKVAGFEWGTGFYINPTPPEEAARFLREVRLEGEPTEPTEPTEPDRAAAS